MKKTLDHNASIKNHIIEKDCQILKTQLVKIELSATRKIMQKNQSNINDR